MTTGLDAPGLTALVFALGVKHGFDPDHLVAIDGLTRASARGRRPVPGALHVARWAGLYFSLGHGAIVTLIGLAVALYARGWSAPGWLEPLGAAVSIAVLAFLGVANLLALWRAAPDAPLAPVGLRGRWLGPLGRSINERLARASHPAMIAAVGAAFALSFDTLSHALVFSLSGAAAAGALFALALGLVFTLGMVLTDALNGWWVARMVQRADAHAAASRWMSLAIGSLCLAIAAAGLARAGFSRLDDMLSVGAPFIGAATFLLIFAVYYRTARRSAVH